MRMIAPVSSLFQSHFLGMVLLCLVAFRAIADVAPPTQFENELYQIRELAETKKADSIERLIELRAEHGRSPMRELHDIRACRCYAHRRLVEDKQQPMRLDGARQMDRLAIAGREAADFHKPLGRQFRMAGERLRYHGLTIPSPIFALSVFSSRAPNTRDRR